MPRHQILPGLVSLAALFGAGGCATPEIPLEPVVERAAIDESIRHRLDIVPNTSTAKNVILFVGDGMGVATVTATRIFDGQSRGEAGEENVLSFERLPHVALIKTYNTNQQVSDSAGTATAMLSGTKTRAGVIGIGPEPRRRDCNGARGHELTTLLDLAERRGLSTGIVTTTRITHATPAAAYAHTSERDFENDTWMSDAERRDCTDIARQLLAYDEGDGIDVVLGGGYAEFVGADLGGKRYDPAADLLSPWLAEDPRRVLVRDAAGLERLQPNRQVLGLFASSHLEYIARRPADTSEPTLRQMTLSALDLLDDNEEGFFLLVEGGRIDHGHHIGRAGFALLEGQAFAETVAAVLDRVNLDETLVLVTADHSHVMTIAGYPTRGNPILGPVVGNDDHGEPAGVPKQAADGHSYATISYANGPGHIDGGPRGEPEFGIAAVQQALVHTRSSDRDGTIWDSETHGGEDVALYAAGPWSHLAGGVLEQNAIFHIMRYALGWDE